MKKYDNYCRNLQVLAQSAEQDLQNEFIISGIIDKFFIQFELGWKLFKELLKYEGQAVAVTGSARAIIKEAYRIYDFLDQDIWLEMLENRNDLAHIYDGNRARELVDLIMEKYVPEFQKVEKAVSSKYEDLLRQGD